MDTKRTFSTGSCTSAWLLVILVDDGHRCVSLYVVHAYMLLSCDLCTKNGPLGAKSGTALFAPWRNNAVTQSLETHTHSHAVTQSHTHTRIPAAHMTTQNHPLLSDIHFAISSPSSISSSHSTIASCHLRAHSHSSLSPHSSPRSSVCCIPPMQRHSLHWHWHATSVCCHVYRQMWRHIERCWKREVRTCTKMMGALVWLHAVVDESCHA